MDVSLLQAAARAPSRETSTPQVLQTGWIRLAYRLLLGGWPLPAAPAALIASLRYPELARRPRTVGFPLLTASSSLYLLMSLMRYILTSDPNTATTPANPYELEINPRRIIVRAAGSLTLLVAVAYCVITLTGVLGFFVAMIPGLPAPVFNLAYKAAFYMLPVTKYDLTNSTRAQLAQQVLERSYLASGQQQHGEVVVGSAQTASDTTTLRRR